MLQPVLYGFHSVHSSGFAVPDPPILTNGPLAASPPRLSAGLGYPRADAVLADAIRELALGGADRIFPAYGVCGVGVGCAAEALALVHPADRRTPAGTGRHP